MSATSPVGVVEPVTEPLMVMVAPWVNDVEDGVSVVVVDLKLTLPQSAINVAASTEPRPVARL